MKKMLQIPQEKGNKISEKKTANNLNHGIFIVLFVFYCTYFAATNVSRILGVALSNLLVTCLRLFIVLSRIFVQIGVLNYSY